MSEARTRRPATIVDIARAAGVSKSTVSLVLSRSPRIPVDTSARVERAARELGYVYNRGAASLRTATSRLVGLVISDLTNPFFAEFAIGVEEAIHRLGHMPVLAHTNEDPARQAEVLETLREYGVAGVVVCPARGTTAEALAGVAGTGLPLVVTVRRVEGSRLSYVGPDNRGGVRQAVEHLIALGHRDVAFLGGFAGMTTHRDRLAGLTDAFAGAGIEARPLVLEAVPSRAGGRETALAALAHARRPTAFVAYNDVVAIGAAHAAVERGLRVGVDVAVVGFDNIVEAQQNGPPLTSVDFGTRALGTRAAEVLMDEIAGRVADPIVHLGPTRLIVRRSTVPPSSYARSTSKETVKA